ncbi:MAG: hypothetical protein UW95_C0022G0010, partial [Parcubacteria group bacterium GW2011_GWC1_45_14]
MKIFIFKRFQTYDRENKQKRA